MARSSLSACIVTQNMAHFLPHCLASVEDLADEIIAVDGNSTDGTRELLEAHPKVRLFQREFVGHFGVQKNFAISQATGDWVLVIDSDEILGDRTIAKIPKLIESAKYTHYKFPRYWILGAQWPLRYLHTDQHYPDFQLRLFRNTEFFRYNEAKVVHTHFPREGRGPGKKMRDCHIFHFDFILKNRDERVAKYRRYLELEPASWRTSRMYLFEDDPHEPVVCKEPMTCTRPDLEALQRR